MVGFKFPQAFSSVVCVPGCDTLDPCLRFPQGNCEARGS
jgi:hypothetical protein